MPQPTSPTSMTSAPGLPHTKGSEWEVDRNQADVPLRAGRSLCHLTARLVLLGMGWALGFQAKDHSPLLTDANSMRCGMPGWLVGSLRHAPNAKKGR